MENNKMKQPLMFTIESTSGRFPSGPTEPANQAGGRFSSGPTLPKPVAGNDSSGWFRSHEVVDIPRQPIVRRRFSCFLCVLHLLAVMLAIWFLYAAVYTIYGILQVR